MSMTVSFKHTHGWSFENTLKDKLDLKMF